MRTEIKIKRLADAARKVRARKSGEKLRWSDEFRARAVDLISSGVSVYQLSEGIGVAKTTLLGWSRGLGKKRRPKGFKKLKVIPTPKLVGRVHGSVEIFVTTSQGSEIHGLSHETLEKLISKRVI